LTLEVIPIKDSWQYFPDWEAIVVAGRRLDEEEGGVGGRGRKTDGRTLAC